MKRLAAAALLLALVLWVQGARLDALRPLDQLGLFGGLQVASLGGAALGLLGSLGRAGSPARRAVFAVAALRARRVAYVPVMVFSGHVASIAEWIQVGVGLPVSVYPVFLLAAASLHAAGAVAATWLVQPPRPWLRGVLAGAFALAVLVSFTRPEDLRPLPDTVWRIEGPIPPLRAGEANPYLPALVGPGYWPNQRVILIAAGLTYPTIPDAPWARGVRDVLEHLFREQPRASTRERVLEHYLAYHSAHPRIGCRLPSDCPPAP